MGMGIIIYSGEKNIYNTITLSSLFISIPMILGFLNLFNILERNRNN